MFDHAAQLVNLGGIHNARTRVRKNVTGDFVIRQHQQAAHLHFGQVAALYATEQAGVLAANLPANIFFIATVQLGQALAGFDDIARFDFKQQKVAIGRHHHDVAFANLLCALIHD